MRPVSQFACAIVLATFAVISSSCDRSDADKTARNRSSSPVPSPTADDIEIASHALTVSDVLNMLRRGNSQELIISRVKQRHFAGDVVEATELELRLNGARRELIAALRDKDNWLTEAQEQAYGQLIARRQGALQPAPATPPPRI